MKPEKEHIRLSEANRTFQYFERIAEVFEPYWHFHPEMELTYIAKGSGIRYVGDSILPFSQGDLVLLGPNLPHQWISGAKSSASVIQFKANELLEIREIRHLEGLFKAAKRGLFFEIDEALKALIASLNNRTLLGRLATLIEVFDRLNDLTYRQLSSEEYVMIHGEGFDKVQRINAYVLEHYHRKIAISEVAEVAHMTRESFCRWFKKETGNTFIDFLNATKIAFASRLLIETREPVSSVAYQVGFDSISQFNRVFKHKKGLSPMQYRKALVALGQ